MIKAVLSVKNRQFIAEENQKIHVFNIDAEAGSVIECDVVGVMGNYKAKGIAKLKVLKHYLGDKKIWFRKNPRNNDRKLKGHRDHKTMLVVEEIRVS